MAEEYTQEKFESDMRELGLLMEDKGQAGGKKSTKKVVKKSAKKVVKKSAKKVVKKSVKKVVKKSVKKGGKKNNEKSNNNSLMGGKKTNKNNNHNGGLKKSESAVRHFKVSKLNGKEVDFGSAEIKGDRTPLSAAKKLLKSIAHHMGLYKSNKLKLVATFEIRETTRGHAKVYGPYHGKYHKYSANELKDASTKGGKILFSMKPMVKKIKQKGNAKREASKNAKMMNHKGGR